MKHRTQKMT